MTLHWHLHTPENTHARIDPEIFDYAIDSPHVSEYGSAKAALDTPVLQAHDDGTVEVITCDDAGLHVSEYHIEILN